MITFSDIPKDITRLFDASFRKLFTLFAHPWLGYPETLLISVQDQGTAAKILFQKFQKANIQISEVQKLC